MLQVTYEATTLPSGMLADIGEERGRVQIRVHEPAPLEDVVRQLNIQVDRFLSRSEWYQLWRDEIVSRETPGCSLRVVYRIDRRAPAVGIGEKRGLVTVYIPPWTSVKEFAAAMNPTAREFLAGGHWFQHYAGEIIDISPEEFTGV